MKDKFIIREAMPEDIDTLMELIFELAKYEKKADAFTLNSQNLAYCLFDKQYAKALIAEIGHYPIGYIVYYFGFPTYTGSGSVNIEDLYIKEQYRRQGVGKQFLICMLQIASQQGCSQLVWRCHKQNETAIAMYKSIGAKPKSDYIYFSFSTERNDR